MAVKKEVRQNVYERDESLCVVRGSLWAMLVPCGGPITLQHRVGRGMGGSKKWDTEPFLVSMCAIHNGLEPASAEFRAFCERQGYSVPRWAADQFPIQRIPIKYEDAWYLLGGAQRYAVPEPVAQELMLEIYGDED